jgi:hypothetical protein
MASHTAITTGAAVRITAGRISVQAVLTCSSGDCSGTVVIEVSNDSQNWLTAGTITFAAAASPQTEGLLIDAPWSAVRARTSAISGTGATMTVRGHY